MYTESILKELGQAVSGIREEELQKAADLILGAGQIFCDGLGRSGLSCKAFAMRLMHLGCRSYFVGETTTTAIQKGDLLLVPDGEDIFFAEVTGDYTFSAALCSEGYPHQRKVKWLKNVSRSDLSMALRSSLKAHQTAADVSRHYEEIEALAFGKEGPALGVQKTIPVSYPLRRDFTVRFEVPENLTKGEAKRLASFFEGLYFEEE